MIKDFRLKLLFKSKRCITIIKFLGADFIAQFTFIRDS